MSSTPDDLDAVRSIAATLEPFNSADRIRILRWAREKLGMTDDPFAGAAAVDDGVTAPIQVATSPIPASGSRDIRSFLAEKAPSNLNHLIAAVAYYHHFEAPTKRETIGKEDVLEACRQAQLKRPAAVGQALVNAAAAGFVDRAERGQYRLNAVGENLVAMVLPEKGNARASAGSTVQPKSRSATTKSRSNSKAAPKPKPKPMPKKSRK